MSIWYVLKRTTLKFDLGDYVGKSLCLSRSVSVCGSVALSVGRSVRRSVCWSVCPSLCLLVGRSVCPSLCLLVGRSVCPSLCLLVGRSVALSVGRSVCRSVSRSVCFGLPMCVRYTLILTSVPQSWLDRVLPGYAEFLGERRYFPGKNENTFSANSNLVPSFLAMTKLREPGCLLRAKTHKGWPTGEIGLWMVTCLLFFKSHSCDKSC